MKRRIFLKRAMMASAIPIVGLPESDGILELTEEKKSRQHDFIYLVIDESRNNIGFFNTLKHGLYQGDWIAFADSNVRWCGFLELERCANPDPSFRRRVFCVIEITQYVKKHFSAGDMVASHELEDVIIVRDITKEIYG